MGAVTFRSLAQATAQGKFDESIQGYMAQPARVRSDLPVAAVMDIMRKSAVTMAFVFGDGEVMGMLTLTDILEVVLGVKV